MHSQRRIGICWLVLLGGASAGGWLTPPAEAETAPPLGVYGHLPTLENMVISPDGRRIAYVRTQDDQRNLYVLPLEKGRPEPAAHVNDSKLRSLKWLDDDNLLLEVSTTNYPPFGFSGPQQEWFQLLTYRVSTRELRAVTLAVRDERTFNVVRGQPMIRDVAGATTLFVPGLYVSNRTLPGLFEYDVASRRVKLIQKSNQPITQWLLDESGRLAAEFVYRDDDKRWTLKARKDDRSLQVASGTAPIDVPRLIGFGAAGDSILMSFVEDDEPVYKPLFLKDGAWGAPLGKGEAFRYFLEDRKTGRVIGGVPDIEDSRLVFFDNELQAHWDAILRAFPGERVHLVSHSDDYSKIVVQVFGRTHGYVYALFHWYTHETSILGSIYEGITTPAEVRPVSYEAADHLMISGYLTLPPGRPEKNLPLIVLPHGGPAAFDTQRFDWWAQALAVQGYAVLQPNYRGSDLDRRLLAAGFHEWGRKMQTDLSDGVRHLAGQGIIDPRRVCIVGASYGGYAALAGMTLDAGVYRCGVSVAGLSDLKRMLRWVDSRAGHNGGLTQRYWDRFMGASGPSDPALDEISPIKHVAAVEGPILLIHGRDDTVVPYEQSDAMVDALKHAGKSVEMVTLKDEDHWLSHTATRLQMLEATVAFLEAHNPAD